MAVKTVEVVMPQMGESLTEATITVWHRQVGESVEEGEPLLDITTQKVEVEVPAPASGVLAQVLYEEGDTVPVDTVIAVLAPQGAEVDAPPPAAKAARGERALAETASPPEAPQREAPAQAPAAVSASGNGSHGNGTSTPAAPSPESVEEERQELLRRRSSPLVRKMALDHGIDLSLVSGTGIHGRVTSRDLKAYLTSRPEMTVQEAKEAARGWDRAPEPPPAEDQPEVVTMSAMRRSIADNLLRSIRTIPHAYTVHEMDFTPLEILRGRAKRHFADIYQLRLTPLVFLVKACANSLLQIPAINARWNGDRIERPRKANIGIAVAVQEGLLVPVLKNVERMSLPEISEGIATLAGKARAGKLKPEDLQGGTFSISSPGQLGAAFAIPIINQQQGAIMHFGAIHKVPAVVTLPDGTDSIAVRQHAMLTLGIDHRLVDGWEADRFMSSVRAQIEEAAFDLPTEVHERMGG